MSNPFTIAKLQALTPDLRLAYVMQNLEAVEKLREYELNRVGTLLAHASTKLQRETSPINGDLRAKKPQEIFEDNASTVGIYQAREIAVRVSP